MAASVLSLAAPVAAQHMELAGGLSMPVAQQSQSYTSSFEPPFPFVTHSGTATQRLTIDPGRRVGAWGSLTWLSRRNIGVEFRGEFARVPLDGPSGPYAISMKYQTFQPPDYVAREFQLDRAMEWPDTDGSVDRLSFSGSLVGVVGNPRRLSLRLSGGVAVSSIAGRFEPLAFTSFQLGGHAVVFWNQYELQAGIDRAWTMGFDGGAEVARALGGRVTVVAGARLAVAPPIDAPVTITGVRGDIAYQALSPEQAQSILSPPPFHWRASALTMVAGVRTRF